LQPDWIRLQRPGLGRDRHSFKKDLEAPSP
jgi:hypothetical protein